MKSLLNPNQPAASSPWLFALSLTLASISSVCASGEGWLTHFGNAEKQAKAEKKDLLLEFTGSDWCPPCMKLGKEVFSKKSFVTASSVAFVLVELDFPQDKKLDDETIKQNEALQEKYKIEGYPTVLLCDAGGVPYAQTGYQPGGPEKYLAHLKELQDVRVKRDAAFAKAESATENPDKAAALVAGLKLMEEDLVDAHYADVIGKIEKLDPTDKTGFVKARKTAIAKKEAEAKAEAAMEQFQGEQLMPMIEAKKFDDAVKATRAFMKDNAGISPEMAENLIAGVSLAASLEKGDVAAAHAVLDQLAKEFPNGEIAKNITEIKADIALQIKEMEKGEKNQ